MEILGFVAVPLGALAVLTAAGVAPAFSLGARVPLDARLALAAPLAAAALSCASPAIYLSVPTRVIGGIVVAALLVLAGLRARHARRPRARLLVPLAVVVVTAAALVAAPNLATGDWYPRSAHGNGDSYVWVSQARALLEGPAPAPSSEFPDRLAYERIFDQVWPVGMPFLLAQLSWLTGSDPVEVYGAFSVLAGVLLALVVYGCARACLGWSRNLSGLAAILVTADGYLLLGQFWSLQAQILLTAFGVLALLLLGYGLENLRHAAAPGALAALATGGGLTLYGSRFAFFVLLQVAVASYSAWRLRGSEAAKSVRRFFARYALAVCAFGLGGIAIALLSAWRVVTRQLNDPGWAGLPHALPIEALGLVPRLPTFERPTSIWTALAAVVGLGLLLNAFAARGGARDRRDALTVSTVVVLLVVAALHLPGPSPYLSLKLLAYGAPLIVLFVVRPFAGGVRPSAAMLGTLTVAAVLFATTTVVTVGMGLNGRTSTELARLTEATATIPGDRRIEITGKDTWAQVWSVYFLRSRPVSLTEPVVYFTRMGLELPDEVYRHDGSLYVLDKGRSTSALWRAGDVQLRRADAPGRQAGALSARLAAG